MNRALLSFALLAVALPAQTTVTSPNIPGSVNVSPPFPSGIGRYQQWYSAASLQGVILEPMRFERAEFFAGSPPTTQAAQIDCEILMAHGKFSGVTGAFDSNYDSPPVVVKPRALVPLTAGALGQMVISLPFTTRFTWDRSRPLLLEIRVHGNSLNNQPFTYNFRGSTTSLGTTTRVYQAGSPQATSGAVLQGVGLVTRFTARPGAVVPFGTGCVGEGGFTPVGTIDQVPWPGITWTHTLTGAASQRWAVWVLGDTNQAPFPTDVTEFLGMAPSGCLLRTNPANLIALQTVGGGAGSGIATLPLNLPAVGSFVGASLFTQWFVLDPLSPNGFIAATAANWSIVAPIGG